MEPAIGWAIGIGSCIFGLGAISAFASRKQRRAKLRTENSVRVPAQDQTTNRIRPTTAISMAAGGIGNITVTGTRIGSEIGYISATESKSGSETEEINFAATGNHTR